MSKLPDHHTFFQKLVHDYYLEHARTFPWRTHPEPYAVLVSELMLQQTQTDRVLPKFSAFMKSFPTVAELAAAPQSAVIKHWQGLGYNRRGRYLHQTAKKIVTDYHGIVPQDADDLENLPGIGPYTATAIQAFAFNQPVVVLETNIRAAYLHHFFDQPAAPKRKQDKISDTQLRPLIEAHLMNNPLQPKDWYSALMDYGSYLKSRFPNPTRKSKHHSTQSRFEGSDRQIRGAIVRALTQQKIPKDTVATHLDVDSDPSRVATQLEKLISEGFIEETDNLLQLAN